MSLILEFDKAVKRHWDAHASQLDSFAGTTPSGSKGPFGGMAPAGTEFPYTRYTQISATPQMRSTKSEIQMRSIRFQVFATSKEAAGGYAETLMSIFDRAEIAVEGGTLLDLRRTDDTLIEEDDEMWQAMIDYDAMLLRTETLNPA